MPTKNATKPGPVACLACRSKHLKCDATTVQTVCSRCKDRGLECVLVPSRRGINMMKDRRVGSGETTPSGGSTIELDTSPNTSYSLENQLVPAHVRNILDGDNGSISLNTPYPAEKDLIMLYYQHIHSIHPFLLPERVVAMNLEVLPPHLRIAMCFMASHFAVGMEEFYKQQASSIYWPGTTDDAFKVQALLILAMTYLARFERTEGCNAFREATDLARKIGTGPNAFGLGQDDVYEESWRRTCAELSTMSSLVVLFTEMDYRFDFPSHMILPVTCENYEICRIMPQKTFLELQDRIFMDEPSEWSSIAYEVEATRILNSVMDANAWEADDATVDAIDASITSFLLSIPADKRDFSKNTSKIDECMFNALFIINLATISLHFPRSGLSQIKQLRTSCTNNKSRLSSQSSTVHGNLALKAANTISRMLASRRTEQQLSPCLACGIVFCIAVQLPAYLQEPNMAVSAMLKEYVQLELNVLNVMAETWPVARTVKGQVAKVAKDTLAASNRQRQTLSIPGAAPFRLTSSLIDDEQWLQDLMDTSVELPIDDLSYTSLTF